ncbi:MAG: MgtC/SapB family protein [Bacteroidales bacterium]|nr:MgtC/SapB family protein [Bacteroidales bacterium]
MPISTFLLRLSLALLCGSIIGLERQIRGRAAGLTTNALVSVGACIFILISESLIMSAIHAGGPVNNDNLRVLAQVVTGIGFLGAGVIIRDGFTVHGLNSAATVWCSAGVGCLCGYGMWIEALASATIILLINTVLKHFEHKMENRQKQNGGEGIEFKE